MTSVIINDILPLTQAIAVGSQTVYSTDWTANYASDVVVYSRAAGVAANDATQILVSSQYSVDFIGSGNIVQVTLVTPSTAGDIVTITRMTPADRLNLYSNTNFVPSMLNNDFGILTLVDQQAQLVNQQVAPRYNYSAIIDPIVDTILPILGANQVWAKNSNNTGIVALNISSATGGVSAGSANQVAYYQADGAVVSGTFALPPEVQVGINSLNNGTSASATTFWRGDGVWAESDGSGIITTGTINELAFYTANGVTLGGIATANNGFLLTSNSGVPFIGTVAQARTLLAPFPVTYFYKNVLQASAVSISNTTVTNITSQVLTTGIWKIYGNIYITGTGTFNFAIGALNTTSATLPDQSNQAEGYITGGYATWAYPVPTQIITVSGTETVYLMALLSIISGTCNGSGNIICEQIG